MRAPSFFASLCFFGVLTLAHPAVAESTDASDIKIGAIFIFTGSSANYGVNSQKGTTLAAEEINAAGGVRGKKIRFIYEDEASSKAQAAVSAYRKLTALDGVKFIVGPNFQDGFAAIAPLVEKEKVFLISPSTPTTEKSPRNTFSTWIDAEHEVDLLAKKIATRGKRLAILSVQQSWEAIVDGRMLKAFPELGGRIVDHEIVSPEATDVKAEVLRVKASKPDVVFVSAYSMFGQYVQELKKQRVHLPIYGIEGDQAYVDSTNGAAEGVIWIGPAQPGDDFVDRYRKRYQSNPDIPASNAYDATRLLAKAIEEVGEDPVAVSNYFRGVRSYQGASGSISFESGRTLISTAFFTVKDGKVTKLPAE